MRALLITEIDLTIAKLVEAQASPRMLALQRKIINQFARQRATLSKKFAVEIEGVLAYMGTLAEKGFVRYQDLYQGWQPEAQESFKEAAPEHDADLVRKIMAFLDITGAIAPILKKKYEAFYQEVFRETHNTVSTSIGLAFGTPDALARKVISEGGKRAGLLDLTADTKHRMFQIIKDGRADGLGPDALARLFRDEIPAGPWSSTQIRADIIAKTETKFAQNVSAIDNYKASGVITGLMAYDNLIGYDDEDCMARDGQVFSFDDAELETADEHPNGTLTWAPYTEDF